MERRKRLAFEERYADVSHSTIAKSTLDGRAPDKQPSEAAILLASVSLGTY